MNNEVVLIAGFLGFFGRMAMACFGNNEELTRDVPAGMLVVSGEQSCQIRYNEVGKTRCHRYAISLEIRRRLLREQCCTLVPLIEKRDKSFLLVSPLCIR